MDPAQVVETVTTVSTQTPPATPIDITAIWEAIPDWLKTIGLPVLTFLWNVVRAFNRLEARVQVIESTMTLLHSKRAEGFKVLKPAGESNDRGDE